MPLQKQLTVSMENTPGTLAKMCSAFAEKKINILAFTSGESQGRSVVRVIVDKYPAAKTALQAIGYDHTEEQVVSTSLPNRPGTLATVARTLGDAGINVDYAYSGAEAGSTKQLVVLSVSDLEQAKRLVR